MKNHQQSTPLIEGREKRAGVRIPIRIKITFPYLLLAIVLALGATYLVYRIVFDNVDERYTNQLIEVGKLSSEWMVREEDRMLESLRQMAYTEGVPEALQAKDAEKLRELTYPIALVNSEEAVIFLDVQGRPVLSMRHRRGGNAEEYEFSQGGETANPQWSFVSKVLEMQEDNLGDKYAGLVPDALGGTFYIAGPVFGEVGSLDGAVLVGKTLPTLSSQMRASTLAQVTLYALDGQAIVSTLIEAEPVSSAFVPQIVTNKANGSLKRDLQTREIQSANINYGEILTAWQARGGEELGVIGAALAKNFLVSMSLPTRNQLLAIIGVAFVFVLLLGINLASLITRPLVGLVHASEEVSKGNLGVQVPPTSNDEIGFLTQRFNEMVSNLSKSKEDLLEAYDSTLLGWSKALELRDQETSGHTERVAAMTVKLASLIGMEGEDLVNTRRGALLHDNGKMGVPDAILCKPGRLTEEEWVVMRKHPQYAYDMLWPIEYLRPALDIPIGHHEKWDGSGYPKGLQGDEIPLSARIFAIIDVWDALRSDRYYRPAMSEAAALKIIREGRGSHFDPRVVDIFLEHLDEIGASVPQVEQA
jgi:HD-GYP domain-containing protein (c-di-GMP phosphodiesterase class II)